MRISRLSFVAGAAAAFGLFGPAPAFAQYTKQVTCDGKKTLPIFDKHYIKKYCGPTICPGSCFGFFPTKWSQWETLCPPGGDCAGGLHGEIVTGTVIESGTPVAPPPAGTQLTAPKTMPKPETAPTPAPAGTKPGDAKPAETKPQPLPLPGTTPPQKPKTEANVVPAPAPSDLLPRAQGIPAQQPLIVPVVQVPVVGK